MKLPFCLEICKGSIPLAEIISPWTCCVLCRMQLGLPAALCPDAASCQSHSSTASWEALLCGPRTEVLSVRPSLNRPSRRAHREGLGRADRYTQNLSLVDQYRVMKSAFQFPPRIEAGPGGCLFFGLEAQSKLCWRVFFFPLRIEQCPGAASTQAPHSPFPGQVPVMRGEEGERCLGAKKEKRVQATRCVSE